MMQELDTVILTQDRPEDGLEKGDMGCIVLVHDGGRAYEVEFVTLAGDTLTLLTLDADEIRPISTGDMPHVRVA